MASLIGVTGCDDLSAFGSTAVIACSSAGGAKSLMMWTAGSNTSVSRHGAQKFLSMSHQHCGGEEGELAGGRGRLASRGHDPVPVHPPVDRGPRPPP